MLNYSVIEFRYNERLEVTRFYFWKQSQLRIRITSLFRLKQKTVQLRWHALCKQMQVTKCNVEVSHTHTSRLNIMILCICYRFFFFLQICVNYQVFDSKLQNYWVSISLFFFYPWETAAKTVPPTISVGCSLLTTRTLSPKASIHFFTAYSRLIRGFPIVASSWRVFFSGTACPEISESDYANRVQPAVVSVAFYFFFIFLIVSIMSSLW